MTCQLVVELTSNEHKQMLQMLQLTFKPVVGCVPTVQMVAVLQVTNKAINLN